MGFVSLDSRVGFGLFCILSNILSSMTVLAVDLQDYEHFKFKHLDINNGLSNNQVNTFLQDSEGFMWFGTGRGLDRFDGREFKNFRHNLNDSTTIPFNGIKTLLEDFEHNIWIGSDFDFVLYNPAKDKFIKPGQFYKQTSIPLTNLQSISNDKNGNLWFINNQPNVYRFNVKKGSVDSVEFHSKLNTNVSNNYVCAVQDDSKGNIWMISRHGEIQQLSGKNLQVMDSYFLPEAFRKRNITFKLFVDNLDDIWIYAPGLPFGVFYLNTTTGEIQNYTDAESSAIRLNNNLVAYIIQDDDNKLWLATDHGGLNIIDKQRQFILYLTTNRDNKYSISQNSINALYKDKNGIIWAGTYKEGIDYYHKNLVRFKHYSYLPMSRNTLPYNDVNCFTEDKLGNLWIGTNGGGLIYFDRKNNVFTTFKHNPDDVNSLSNNVIVSLYNDRDGNLWIGTYYGGLNRLHNNKFYHYRHNPDDPYSISDDRIWEITEDSQHNLWIGTLNGGLNLFDREKDQFFHYKADEMNSVGSNFVMAIIEDSQHNLWMGTDGGIDKLDLTSKRFYHYAPEQGVEGKLSDRNAVDLLEDSRGLIWIATHQGLNVFDHHEGKFRVFTESDGLVDANIKTIQEDQQGHLWVATTNGLSKIQILDSAQNVSLKNLHIKVTHYDMTDGLQGKEFNEKAAYRTRTGELIFGGSNGFNLFIPEEIDESIRQNKIVLTNLKVFNQQVKVGVPFRDRVILDKSITNQNEIVLHHNENVLSFEVAALDFFHPEKNMFQYRLDGFKDEWLKLDGGKDISFTNLNAGNYKLRIRVSSDGQNWVERQTPLSIKILPPFWKSKWGILIYIVVILTLLYFLRRMLLERQRLKFDAEHERIEAERMIQVDAIKTRFFTNISHEFRTPLTLIISPLEKLLLSTKDEQQRNNLVLIHRNAKRLLSMVNQLLDFRKMEFQKIEVIKTWGDLVAYIKEVGLSFTDMAENKAIQFSISASQENFYTYFDRDKLDKIISNLLVNAFKFTNNQGEVSLQINVPDLEGNGKQKQIVQFVVRDNGIGISPEKQHLIFERFYQNSTPTSIVNQGTGIGLSMVKEYVTLLGGDIQLTSNVDEGSEFVVTVPVEVFSQEEIEKHVTENHQNHTVKVHFEHASVKVEEPVIDNRKKTVLLVEDNSDLRFYLKDNLKTKYNVLEADNGADGWDLVQKHIPHLVVSDVVMPIVSGIELCSKIKANKHTRNIPVILLTAKVEKEPELEGLDSGADDYIFKPFDFRILESRIENLIKSREQLRLSYQAMIGINPGSIEVNSQDEKFIKKALEMVEKNISEPAFSVEDLSREMGMSRVSLYKKIMALTQKSPIEFIRIIRLKRAADLLKNSQFSVSEIAYQVGFNNPRYFSKYFEELYGELPSIYITKHRQIQTEISEETKQRFNI